MVMMDDVKVNCQSILLEKSSGVFWGFPGIREIWEIRGISGNSGEFREFPGNSGEIRGFPGNPGISGVPGDPPKTPKIRDFRGFSGFRGNSGEIGGFPGPGSPGRQGRIPGGDPGGARIRGPESATLARFLGVFRGAAALLINVFFGQVLVCFLVRRGGARGGGAGGISGKSGILGESGVLGESGIPGGSGE